MTTSDTTNDPTQVRIAWHCTCFNVRRASRAVTEFYDGIMAPSGVKATQFTMLGAVSLMGPASVTTLAEHLKKGGSSAEEQKVAGLNLQTRGSSAEELKRGQLSTEELKSGKFLAEELKKRGSSAEEQKEAGPSRRTLTTRSRCQDRGAARPGKTGGTLRSPSSRSGWSHQPWGLFPQPPS